MRDNITKYFEPTIGFLYQSLGELGMGTVIPNTGFREIGEPKNQQYC